MVATATLSTNSENLPTFIFEGRAAGAFNGILARQSLASGAGISPAATGADNVIAAYTLPANTLNYSPNGNSITGIPLTQTAGLKIRVWGHFAANANNKTVKIIWNPATAVVGSTVGTGGTTLVTSGVVAINGLGFYAEAFVMATGIDGANTQVCGQTVGQFGATFISPPVTQYTTAVQSTAILIAVTGNAATTATDIVLDCFEVGGSN